MADRGSGEVRYVGSDAARVSQGRTGAAAADVMFGGIQGTGQAVTQIREISGESKPPLEGRDRLLEATAKAANVLLTLENFDEAISTALRIIGEGTGCDRISVLENSFAPSSPLPIRYSFIYDWALPEFLIPKPDTEIPCLPADQIDPVFLERYFLQGEGFGGLLEEWEEPTLRGSFEAAQVQSAYSVPIRVNGHWWGVLCFDYCRAPIRISPAEVSVVRMIADCIGSAIQRDRTQKIILEAEQARVAELVRANTALKQSLDALATDPDLDGFIGHSLKLIAQQLDAPLIEYRLHPIPKESVLDRNACVRLSCWQGQLVHPAQVPEQAFSQDITPFLSILLSVGETTMGALTVYLSGYRPIRGQTMELAHALAQQLTLALELTRLGEEAQQAALLQERTRLARDIHDTLAQAFGGILMQLQAATYFASAQPEKAQNHLTTAQTLAQEGLAEARRSVWTLYLESQEYEDPAGAIAKFIEQVSLRQSTPIQLTLEGTPYRLHPDVGLNLLRIAQESLNNALRHAQAQTIDIHLSYVSDRLQLQVRDDGCGFQPQSSSGGFGLLGMQQRAARIGATWHLVSQVGQGTTITVTVTNPVILSTTQIKSG